MDPSLAARLIAPSWKTFGDCIPTDPRPSWYSHAECVSAINTICGVPADTASTKIKSSPAVHLELVAMFSLEYLARDGREMVTGSRGFHHLSQSLSSPVVRDISGGAPTLIAVLIKTGVCVEMFRYRRERTPGHDDSFGVWGVI